ncbi:DUF4328 domain-containing protein [Pyxidicoccus caerfyrddinensis]|uniref:DUF4328 domain-containing protein n=1 Tax=Pyxidicoccus caerfyrddinensis TaxID=2709663 RepID=UPI001F082037|nr:DUF4328 domain-containing protein [Pyxidicoccus caerfyrddinensis]
MAGSTERSCRPPWAWWASWLLQFVLNRVSEVVMLLTTEADPGSLRRALLTTAAAELLSVVAAVLGIHTVRAVQLQLEARRAEAAAS